MPADTVYLIVDTNSIEGRDLHNQHGDTINGTPVVEEVRFQDGARCEHCGDHRADAYRLADQDDLQGIPVCRNDLEAYDWVHEVVTADEIQDATEGQ